LAPGQLLEEGFFEAALGAVVDVFDGRVGMSQAGVAQSVGQSSVVAYPVFAVEQEDQLSTAT